MLQLTILIIPIQLIKMLWGAGTGVYGTAGIYYCNPSTNTFYTNGDIVVLQHPRLKDTTNTKCIRDKILKLVVI
jgi:hypothetical protein